MILLPVNDENVDKDLKIRHLTDLFDLVLHSQKSHC